MLGIVFAGRSPVDWKAEQLWYLDCQAMEELGYSTYPSGPDARAKPTMNRSHVEMIGFQTRPHERDLADGQDRPSYGAGRHKF